MLPLYLPPEADAPLRLLCLGAHADDIEIGCGGTVLRLLAERPDTTVRWIVFSGREQRAEEARQSADAFLEGASDGQVDILQFRDGYFPYQGADIKDWFEALKRQYRPSLVLTHWEGDAHQDHRLIAELTRNTFRDALVLSYEIPKYDGDIGRPNLYVPLMRAQAERKLGMLRRFFPSQAGRGWFTDDTFVGLARLRGIECNAPDGLAEAFHVNKAVVSFRCPK
jgi:LmbE family N-acetylglucosaminyl deacetylase